MIIFLLIALLLLMVAGFAALIYSLHRVVDGYQDESGFHEGNESPPEGVYMAMRALSTESLENGWAGTRLSQQPVPHHGTLSAFPGK